MDASGFPTHTVGANTYSLQPLDVTVATRDNGSDPDTFVAYIKAIWKDDADEAESGVVHEECVRDIYQATSPDLVEWTIDSTPVVTMTSVPEAYVDASGRVWLYYQDFTDFCDNGGSSNRAPVLARWELDDGTLSEPVAVEFDEPFETDATEHYATNPTPVLLPDDAAMTAYEGCL